MQLDNQITGCDISVKIASDYYEAYITVDCANNPTALTKDLVIQTLADKNVVFGLDTNAIDALCANPANVVDYVVARGIRHQNGKDGEITYHFNTSNEVKPTVNDDGTVDFKSMNFLHPVKQGQVLATRTMPTEGSNGTTVTGKTILYRKGKIINFKAGKNVVQSESGVELLAEASGNLEFDGQRVAVIEVLEIRDDVGVSTGNIDFSGKVVINGNVTTGYSVRSDEEIIINGIVEGATIVSGGDLYINGGIQGHDSANIDVAGNIVSKFINNSKVVCKGNIDADAIMHSEIMCTGDIMLKGKKSLLVGGEIVCRGNIVADVIGSEMGTTTSIKLGVDPTLLQEYHDVVEELNSINESIMKLTRASRMLRKQYERGKSIEIKEMIDRTEISRTDYTKKSQELSNRQKELSKLLELLNTSKIKAGTLYSGVRVKMGQSYYVAKTAMLDVVLMKESGEIKACAI